ncbi:MAG: FHA domain-containing protein [Myxococcales bacterium]|nr:FHA domain-containing protein [Myxococcales bacterium]
MTRDLDCSMDYLINESMRHYARSRNYSLTGMSRLQDAAPVAAAPPQPQLQPSAPVQAYGTPQDARTMQFAPVGYNQQQPGQGFHDGQRSTTPRMPPPPPQQSYSAPPPPQQPPQQNWQAQPAYSQPKPPPRVQLSLFFNGQRYVISKDRFIIGRGSQGTDLTIRDGNISRKHAAIIYHEGAYYIQDLGSTNGVEFNGNKVDSRRIEEGDLYNVCDYELRFSYQG